MIAQSYPGRPALGLRIGITGARSLDPAQCARLSSQLRAVLHAAKHQMQALATTDARVRDDYFHAPGAPPQPFLRLLSPLARGADRLAAREALALGYSLHVPMPFPQAEYEKDFETPEDLAEFLALLAQAGDDWLALDAEHGPHTNRAYEAVGRYVVRHCEILIAIWDGGPSGGRGGTEDIVRFATHMGVPVCWLHAAQDRAPLWITHILDLRYPPSAPVKAEAALQDYLKSLVPPPPPWRHHRQGLLGRLANLGQSDSIRPETEHFAERRLKRSWPWRAYATLIHWASGVRLPWSPSRQPDDPVALYWFDRYEPTDARAGEYAARYRSAYVWVFLLGTLALVFGASALVLSLLPSADVLEPLTLAFTLGELIALIFIFALVLLGLRRDWHERSIEYRLLAELCRKQQALAPLGWALPITTVQGIATVDRAAPDRGAWVAWLFAAEQRAAPLPRGELANAAKGEARRAVLQELIAEQRVYHAHRFKMAKAAGHALERAGEIVFVAVVVCVSIKLLFAHVLDLSRWAIPFGWLATVLPGISAAFVGIRAYSELQLLAAQSHHMAAELACAQQRVENLDSSRPLVSQDLGAEAAGVATLMLQDLEGWAQLFRVKGMEPG